MNISIDNKCAFKSKISLVNDMQEFVEIAYKDAGDICADENVVKGKAIHTIGISTCIGGGASNKNLGQGCLFHYCEPRDAELNDIYEGVNALNNPESKPKVLITGGIYPWYLSERYFGNVMEKLKAFQDTTSVIWGQKDHGFTHLHYGAENDTWTMFHGDFQDNKPINSLEDLKNIYHIVKIAPSDELIIKGKKINTEA